MIDENNLKEILVEFAENNKTMYIMVASVLAELAALRETVRGLDLTFDDLIEKQRDKSEESGATILASVIAGYDAIIQKLKEGQVC